MEDPCRHTGPRKLYLQLLLKITNTIAATAAAANTTTNTGGTVEANRVSADYCEGGEGFVHDSVLDAAPSILLEQSARVGLQGSLLPPNCLGLGLPLSCLLVGPPLILLFSSHDRRADMRTNAKQ